MRLNSPFERIQELMGLLELNPTKEQLSSFLSKNLDPFGEICGVSIGVLGNDGLIRLESLVRFKIQIDANKSIPISNDNPACVSLRTGKSQIVSLASEKREYSDLPEVEKLIDYMTGVDLPVSEDIYFGFALTSSIEKVKKYRDYFEVVRLILTQYQSKAKSENKTSSHLRTKQNTDLTQRQLVILEMIKEGRTNGSIATILGYSESLIRQETILIYKKLGIAGRREIEINRDKQHELRNSFEKPFKSHIK